MDALSPYIELDFTRRVPVLTAKDAYKLSSEYLHYGITHGPDAMQYVARTVLPTIKGSAITGARHETFTVPDNIKDKVMDALEELGYVCEEKNKTLLVSWSET